jgi:hypothetical protein
MLAQRIQCSLSGEIKASSESDNNSIEEKISEEDIYNIY